MNVGYACQCLSNVIPSFRTCTRRFATEENLISIIDHNLKVLDQILNYNHQHDIRIFRLSSDLIPFGSSPVNRIEWRTMFQSQFHRLGEKARRYGIRLTMHPGQYTILNTPDEEVLYRSMADLRYHCDILNLMGMDQTCKLILHIGGIYGDKTAAMQRFQLSFYQLDEDIRQRLIIENDDRYYTLEDVLYLAEKLNIPVVFDNLHHEVLPSFPDQTLLETLLLVKQTWNQQDGRMKIHYSQQEPGKRKGAHASHLHGAVFLDFLKSMNTLNLDIMLEIKSKNLAVFKAIDLMHPECFDINNVWQRYRYLILRHSLAVFTRLEQDRSKLNAEMFYVLIDQALEMKEETAMICFRLIYQEWKDRLSEAREIKLLRAMDRFQAGKLSEQGLRNAFLMAAYEIGNEENYLFL